VVDHSLWAVEVRGNGPAVGQGGGAVAIFLPAHASGAEFGVLYRSIPRLHGDFDIQVDYSLPLWPLLNGVRVGLGDVGGTNLGAVERVSWGPRDPAGRSGEGYATDFIREGRTAFAATTELTGRLRVVRTGARATGYRWESETNQWRPIHSGPVSTADIRFAFGVWSHDGAFMDQNVVVTFANFQVNEGTLAGTP
jgi:hypothetical protein